MKSKTKSDIHKKKFTKDILWVGLSQIFIYLFGFFTLPALTKNFGAELYGLWSQILVTVGLLNPILTLHLGTAIVRYLSAENIKDKLGQSFSNAFCIIVLVSSISILIAIVLETDLSYLIFRNSAYGYYIILAFIWAGITALLGFLIAYLRARGKIKELSLINVLCGLFKFIPLFILAYLNFPLYYILIVQIIVESIFVISLFSSTIRKIGFKRPNKYNLKKYLSFSIPQIPSGALLWILNSSDRYFITGFLGLSQTGIYSASYNIGNLISMFYIPISFVVFPVISAFWEKNEITSVKEYLEFSTNLFLFFAVPASFGLYILSNPLLQVLTTSQFLVGGGLLTFLIALSTIFLGIFNINLYIIYLIEKTKFVPLIVGLSAFINIILNILLIPNIGIFGASISTIFSYLVLSTIVLIWAKKRVNYSFNYIFLFKVIFSSVVMILVIQFLPFVATLLNILIMVVIGSLIYLILTSGLKTFSKEELKLLFDLIVELKNILYSIINKIKLN